MIQISNSMIYSIVLGGAGLGAFFYLQKVLPFYLKFILMVALVSLIAYLSYK